MGELAVTRAIGDREYKGKLKEETFGSQFKDELVIADPEIEEWTITPEDEFLILACDGLWDVFENQEAVDFVKLGLETHQKPDQVLDSLVNQAIQNGSMDNVTCVLVVFSSTNGSSASVNISSWKEETL
jgi:protein phosphatase 2C family protein 2/3